MHGCDVILQAVILADPKGLNMVLYLAWGRWSNEELTFIKHIPSLSVSVQLFRTYFQTY